MGWLALGAAYSILYAVIGAYLRPFADVLPWFRIVALLIPPLAGVTIIVEPTAYLGRLPLALLGHAGARPVDVGHQRHRVVGRRDAARCQHLVAGVARGLCAVRRRRAAAGAAGAAASRSPRESHRDDCGRHRRHRRADGLPLFTFRCRVRSGRGSPARQGRCCCSPSSSSFSSASVWALPRCLRRIRAGSRYIGGSRLASRLRSSR